MIFHAFLATRLHPALPSGAPGPAVMNAPQLDHASRAMDLFRPVLFSLVGAFFALSGFLVTGSAIRTQSVVTFFTNRALRILPALSVEVTLSALILGPALTSFALGHYFSDPLFARYFWNIVGHVQFALPGVFGDNPWPVTVNLNLWTLPAELYSYLFMLLILASGLIRSPHWTRIVVTIVAFVALVAAFAYPALLPVKANNTHFTEWYIVFMFILGSAFFLYGQHVPLHAGIFVASALAFYAMVYFDLLLPLAGIPLTYCVLYVGMQRFAWFDRIVRVDLSYGTYLYGFPITQTVTWLLLHHVPALHSPARLFAATVLITLVATCAFAALSWHWIEKPALALRRFLPPAKKAARLPPEAPIAAARATAADAVHG
ncbi:acyltransferase [Sphingomonas morindae]|uniref:Acyltransferase n=1 Tax=Sphingomonas morindae TaxID=1541170 RepID=A0ABY4XBY1_9SPHN|nr:acyltransferase [Sphingomonas morindae]USI74329.1 acyltransferase [Sphingomonas morindae]